MGTTNAATGTETGWKAWYDQRRRTFEQALQRHLNAVGSEAPLDGRLAEAVRYCLTLPGKRLRPVLVLESCHVAGGRVEHAMPAALAIECIHTFSLIHDDLPCMDDGQLRRGKPTCHRVFGEAVALLAGDWLVAHAFELLARCGAASAVGPCTRILAQATAAMVVGQAADLEGEKHAADLERVAFIHARKTAALIEACCAMGAVIAEADEATCARLSDYGRHLGLAFQIIDDLLDCTQTTETLGKQSGSDAAVGKQTWPAAVGIEASRRRAADEVTAALAAIECFDARARGLRGLARFVLSRDR